MSLFKATIKRSATTNGIRLEKGMTVEVVSKFTTNPLNTNGGHEVSDAFLRKFGIDIRKANAVSSSYIDMLKIN